MAIQLCYVRTTYVADYSITCAPYLHLPCMRMALKHLCAICLLPIATDTDNKIHSHVTIKQLGEIVLLYTHVYM